MLLIITPIAIDAIAQNFVRVELESGFGHINESNGVAVADYDQDGDIDVFFTGMFSFNPEDESTWNRLMRNNGHGIFEDVTVASGFVVQFVNPGVTSGHGDKLGASWGDYDNDGFPDLFLANIQKDQLYHNKGDGTFVDVTERAGVAGTADRYSSSGLWWDHDRDGDLDLYVNNLKGANTMYENRGDGYFFDITAATGLGGFGVTWASVAIDVGNDGFLDLYNANDTQENQFFESRAGVFFNEASKALRLNDEGAGMGLAVGDYNNDGFFDIYVSNIFNYHPNPLFTYNNINRRFEDLAVEMGVDNAAWGWGTKFFDCDHDGDEDLYVVTGVMSKSTINNEIQVDENNFFFKNLFMEGTEGFQNWSVESTVDGEARGRGLETFDCDGDGDLDMVVANVEVPAYLYRNELITDSKTELTNWLQIWLEGTASNRDAFGTEVKIAVEGKSYYRWHHGAGIFGQSITPVHFGVGSAQMIDEIQVSWPLGKVEYIYNVPVNQTIRMREGENSMVTGLEDELEERLLKVYNYPNPFSNSTTLHFELASSGNLNVKIFSISGKELYNTTRTSYKAGSVDITWSGEDIKNVLLPPGIYFYTADFENQSFTGKLLKGPSVK